MFFSSNMPDYYNLFLIITFGFYLISSLCYSTVFSSIELYCFPQLNSSSISNTSFVVLTLLILVCLGLPEGHFTLLNGSFIWNFYCAFFSIFLLFSTLAFLYSSKEFTLYKKFVNFEYDIIIVFALLGLCLVNISNDFLTLYLAIELHSLCFYVLATFNKNSEYCAEASMKYFILGAFSSGLLLCSFAFFYVSVGSVSLESIEHVNLLFSDNITAFAAIFLIVSLLFKLGAFPFHMWLCDVYDGSSLNVMALFATIPKIVVLSFLLRFLFTVFSELPDIIIMLLTFSGLGSIAFASVAALYQKRIKRLLAYSTVSHTGFLVLSVVCCSVDSIKACIIYIAIYVLMNLALFGLLFLSGLNNEQPKYLVNWTSFFDRNVAITLVFTMILFSMAGIPPLAGFYSKLCVFISLLSSTSIIVPLSVVIFSSIACFYYIRLIKILSFAKEYKKSFWFGKGTKQVELFLSLTFSLITLFLVRPNALINIATMVAISLF